MTAMSVIALLKPFLVGLLDASEYAFFNPSIYVIHNFPDIVPYMPPGIPAAFVSGVVCSLIYIPLALAYWAFGLESAY